MAVQADVDEELYVAALSGEIDTIKALFSSDPTPNVDSTHSDIHETALHAAARQVDLPLVKYLIGKGANQQVRDGLGHTAAYELCWHPNIFQDSRSDGVAVLQFLVENDRSIMDSENGVSRNTYLHAAAACGNAGLIQWLLDAGADATIRNHRQDTAWDIAIDHLYWRQRELTSARLEYYSRAYEAFVRKEIQSGNINATLQRFKYQKRADLEIYRLKFANIVDLYILLEHLSYLTPLQQAWRQIRQELCHFVATGNRWGYREPSCVFGIENRQHTKDGNNAAESVCDKGAYESFKAMVSEPDLGTGSDATGSDVSKSASTHGSCKAKSQKSLSESIEVTLPSPVERSQKTFQDAKTQEQTPAYLSVVMPSICLRLGSVLKSLRENISGDFEYRSDDRPDLQGYHSWLTIDEYCYPALSKEILTRRNEDQVIQRASEDLINASIVIDQAWIWLTGDVLIHTALGGYARFQAPTPPESNLMQVGRFLAGWIDNSDSDRIFDAFQNYIVLLTEKLSGYIDRKGIESMTIKDEKEFYHNINDVREELSMLRRVLSQQEEVWRTFTSNVWPEIWADCQNGRSASSSNPQNKTDVEDHRAIMRLIMRPRLRIQKSQQRISQLDEDAERVERSISNLLDLKQKYASLQEAHATAVMSTAVFGFTIITIIFTPLSFVMSLFALPIDRFQNSQIPSRWSSDTGMYSTNYIGTWAATTEVVSIFLTILAMWLALEYGLRFPLTLKVWLFFKNSNEKIYWLYQRRPRNIESLKFRMRRSRKSRDEESSAGHRSARHE